MAMANPGEKVQCGQPLSAEWLNYLLENAGGDGGGENTKLFQKPMIFTPVIKTVDGGEFSVHKSIVRPATIQGQYFENCAIASLASDDRLEDSMTLGDYISVNLTFYSANASPSGGTNFLYKTPIKAGIRIGETIDPVRGLRGTSSEVNMGFEMSSNSTFDSLIVNINISYSIFNITTGNITQLASALLTHDIPSSVSTSSYGRQYFLDLSQEISTAGYTTQEGDCLMIAMDTNASATGARHNRGAPYYPSVSCRAPLSTILSHA